MWIKIAFLYCTCVHAPEAWGTHLGGFPLHVDAAVPDLAEEAGLVGALVGHPVELDLGR